MVRFILHKDRGYIRTVNPRPSENLVAKLKSLGWKPGQCVYWNRNDLELRFFDSIELLHKFLDNRKQPEDAYLDFDAEMQLKLEEFESQLT